MIKSRPYFRVSEKVKLVTEDESVDGEYVVNMVLRKGDQFRCRLTGKTMTVTGEGVGYLLDTPIMDVDSDTGVEVLFSQECLRKQPWLSDMTFEELIEDLNQPYTED